MRVVTRSCAKASTDVQTGQDEADNTVPRESIWIAEEMTSCQAPVKAIESKMFRKPIFQLISTLKGSKRSVQVTRRREWSDTTHSIKALYVLHVLLNA